MSAVVRGLWYLGMAVTGGAILVSNLVFARRLRRGRVRLDCAGPLPVYTVSGLTSPCLFGLLRPAIYLPKEYAEASPARDHMLTHEQCHWRQGDLLWSVLRCAALALHWYNPLVWLAVRCSRQDGELACDAAAIRRLGEAARSAYGHTLLHLLEASSGPAALLSCATTMGDSPNALKQRMTQIVRKPRTLLAALLCTAAVLVVAVGCTFTGAPDTIPDRDAAAISDDTAQASGVQLLAEEFVRAQAEALAQRGIPVASWQITGLTLLNPQDAPYAAWRLEYAITPEHGETVTELTQMGQPVLLLYDDGITVTSLGQVWSGQVEQEFGGDYKQALLQAEVDVHAARVPDALEYDREAGTLKTPVPEQDGAHWQYALYGRYEVDGNGFSYHKLIEAGEACTVPSGFTELWLQPLRNGTGGSAIDLLALAE